jgi:hypothetical protein
MSPLTKATTIIRQLSRKCPQANFGARIVLELHRVFWELVAVELASSWWIRVTTVHSRIMAHIEHFASVD